ncbi:Taf7p [Sugiyamaella lignohabitans]|uniref:Taf7p n=1 Tax=Sugiyamaella lignohabitans TaxID=796027 RepID=A0A167F9D1_9ASCO|nr:Taf7p [Sugiyamaella lignohabitans]ANB14991.1 Taf7p [Sugiyamaella lignohabitans]
MALKLKLKAEKRPNESGDDDRTVKPTKIKVKKPRKSRVDVASDRPSTSLRLNLKTGADGTPTVIKKKRTGIPRIKVKAGRKPGDGYDSEAPDREEDPVIEEAVILRMLPGEHLDYLRAACEQGDLSKVSIKFKDPRRAVVTIHDQLFAAQLVDLPTVTEAQKSFDRKNIYKSADVCQMLLVTEPIELEEEALSIKLVPQQYPHGLTPPMYYARQRRFRKRISNKVIETVEAKVDELFRLDEEAEESRYELLNPNMLATSGSSAGMAAANASASGGSRSPRASSEPSTPFDMLAGGEEIEVDEGEVEVEVDGEEDDDLLGLELERALQEEGEAGGDGDLQDDAEDDDDGMFSERKSTTSKGKSKGKNKSAASSGDVSTPAETPGAETGAETGVDDDEEEEDDEDDDDDDDSDDDDDNENDDNRDDMDEDQIEAMYHNQLLKEEISELESTIEAKQRDANNTVNQIMKGRLLDVVNKLRQELEMKRRVLKVSDKESNTQSDGQNSKAKDDEEDDGDADPDADNEADGDAEPEDNDNDNDEDVDDDVESLF